MRLRLALLVMVFLPIGISPLAKAPAAMSSKAKGKGGAMSQRILYSPMPVDAAVRDAKPEFLGKSDKGAWFALDDAAALRLRKDDSSVTMLYPSREEYDLAVEGLNEAQIQEAIAWRHKVWTPRVAPELMGNLFEAEGTMLARLARLSTMPNGAPFKAAFDEEFRLLNKLLYEDRYQGSEFRSHLEHVFEPLNDLNQELEGLRGHAPDTSVFPAADLAAKRLALALETETVMQKYGLHTGSPPTGQVNVVVQRGVHATPNQPMIVKSMLRSHEPVQEWQGGFVALWDEWDLASLTQPGHKVEILYWDASRLLEDFSRLTTPQRVIKFGRLQKGNSAQALWDHLAGKHLVLALDLFNVAPLIAKGEPALSSHLAKHAEIELEALRLALAARPAWGADASIDAASMLAYADRSASDFRFWQGWVAASRWVDYSKDIDGVTDAKTAAVDHLKKAMP